MMLLIGTAALAGGVAGANDAALPSCRRPNPHPPPKGECCFGIKHCMFKGPLHCPHMKSGPVEPIAKQCESEDHCLGVCSHTPLGPGIWCPSGPDAASDALPAELDALAAVVPDARPRAAQKHPPARFVRDGRPALHERHELGYTVIEETLVTQAYYLADGDLIFTDFASTPIPMPEGDYAILGLSGEMVDCNNQSVPLDTLYNHHWLLKPIAGPMHHDNAPCPQTKGDSNDPYGLNRFTYVFGVGAESRKTPTVMPDGFGYHVQAGTKWG
eukprot:COSAG04_NODE_4102_length_2302_cov_1.492056_2_plen_271_part_00